MLNTNVVCSKDTKNDEIDLLALLLLLWEKKLAIILMVLVFFSGGVTYAFMSPQVWSATAEITLPDYPSQSGLQKVVNALVVISPEFSNSDYYKDSPVTTKDSTVYYRDKPFDRYGVYNSFVDFFNNQEVLDDFFNRHGELHGDISFERKAKKPSDQDVSVILKATSENSEKASTLLASYIDFYLSDYRNRKKAELSSAMNVVIDTLSLKLNISDSEADRIALKKQIEIIKGIDVHSVDIVPFSYQQKVTPSVTMDKPKRAIIIALSIMLGLMLGVGFVMLKNAWETGLKRK